MALGHEYRQHGISRNSPLSNATAFVFATDFFKLEIPRVQTRFKSGNMIVRETQLEVSEESTEKRHFQPDGSSSFHSTLQTLMKSHFLPLVVAVAAFPAHAQPTSRAITLMKLDTRIAVKREEAPTRAMLPTGVAAGVPLDAQSLHLGRFPLGPNRAPRLVYVWFEPSHTYSGGPHSSQSVFEVDVFAPGAKTGGWKRVSFARYKSSNWPDFIEVRFQQPRVQRGAVVALWCSTDYGSQEVDVATLRNTNANPATSGAMQRFTEDPNQTQRLGLDARGITAMVQTTQEKGKRATTKVFVWNGREYVARTPKS